jgi:predicted ester cyclase
MAIDIKQASRKILEDVFGKGKFDYLDQVCDASFKSHDPLTGDADVEGFKQLAQMYRAAFPDLTPTVLATCAEGDTVCTRWQCVGTHQRPLMGFQPTGKKLTIEGISFDRYRNGKLVESWAQWDTLHLLQGVGALPRLELGEAAQGETRPSAH